MAAQDPHYLGDGVVATFDGWYIWLKTDRDDEGARVTHRIALDPTVFEALLEYQSDLVREANERGESR